MRAIDTIVQVAMLGTATQALTTVEAPEPLERLIEQLRASSPDRESFLYEAAAATFAYHRAGWTPERLAEASAPVETAPEESLPTLSAESIPLFASLLSTSYLLAYALQKALPLQRILPPVLLPKLLERMRKRNLPRISEELEALQVLGGHRFPWLMNLAGLKILQARDSSAWDTSTHRERRAILANLHGQDPAGAIELLEKDWKGLSSSHRMDFLWELGRNPNPTDEPFLQSVMEHDRSSQVRELAMHLLGGFPESALVQRSRAILRGHIHYSRLTGWHYDTIAFTQEMKSLGLQEVSSRSNESDSAFILRQLAERMPLDFWCELFDCAPEKAAIQLAKHPPFGKQFQLTRTITTFSDKLWAFHTLQTDSSWLFEPPFGPSDELIGLLTFAQREEIEWPKVNKERDDDEKIPLKWCGDLRTGWGPKFSRWVLRRCLHLHGRSLSKEDLELLVLLLDPGELENARILSSQSIPTPIRGDFYEGFNEILTLKSKIDAYFNNYQ